MRGKIWLLGLLIVALAYVPQASAAIELSLASGATSINITDNGAGDSNPAVGQITFIGAVGLWTLNVSTGTVGTNPLIDLNSVNTSSGAASGANALTMMFSGTDFVGPTHGFASHIGGTLATGASLSYQGYESDTNSLFAMDNALGGLLSFSTPPLAFSGATGSGLTTAALYSLTQQVVLSASTAGTSSFDAAIDIVPEPASVVLLGGALLLSFGLMRRKLRIM